jgi:REP element-mobilizing transposase RayT
LNGYGQIAHDEWLKTCEIRPNVELGEFVVMPNHVHGIVRICRGELHSVDGRGELHSPRKGELHTVDGRGELHSPRVPGELHSPGDGELHSPQGGVCKTPLRGPSQTVGAIIRGYKSAVTKQLGLMGFVGKLWQRNYWEHIIRDETSYIRISDYIINNPAKWADDKFYEK